MPPPDDVLTSVPGPPKILSTSAFGISILSLLNFSIVSDDVEVDTGVFEGVLEEFDGTGVLLGGGGEPLLPFKPLRFGHVQPITISKRITATKLIEFFMLLPFFGFLSKLCHRKLKCPFPQQT